MKTYRVLVLYQVEAADTDDAARRTEALLINDTPGTGVEYVRIEAIQEKKES